MPPNYAKVSCIPGWDGGLSQTFTLEVRESKYKHSRILASVQHSSQPYFDLKRLKPHEHYLFIITAVNDRGTSPPVTVSYITPIKEVSTLASNAHTGNNTTWISWTSFVAVIFGVMLTVLACLCAIIGLMKFKAPPVNNPSKHCAKIVYATNSLPVGQKQQEKIAQDLPVPTSLPQSKCKY